MYAEQPHIKNVWTCTSGNEVSTLVVFLAGYFRMQGESQLWPSARGVRAHEQGLNFDSRLFAPQLVMIRGDNIRNSEASHECAVGSRPGVRQNRNALKGHAIVVLTW